MIGLVIAGRLPDTGRKLAADHDYAADKDSRPDDAVTREGHRVTSDSACAGILGTDPQ